MTRNRHLFVQLLLAVPLLGCLCSVAFASSIHFKPYLLTNGNIGIVVGENCNGTINGFAGLAPLPCGFQNDPGPSGLDNVMTYDMRNPPGLVAGDVLLTDADAGGIPLDVIRFNPNETGPAGGVGSLVFYSDNLDGFDSGADTLGPPRVLYANFLLILELGREGKAQYAVYTPTASQPGFVAGASAPVQYTFVSDTPEPGTLGLLGIGLMGLVGVIRRKLKG